jgi:hypothetical protein
MSNMYVMCILYFCVCARACVYMYVICLRVNRGYLIQCLGFFVFSRSHLTMLV